MIRKQLIRNGWICIWIMEDWGFNFYGGECVSFAYIGPLYVRIGAYGV